MKFTAQEEQAIQFARQNVLAFGIAMDRTFQDAVHLQMIADRLHALEQRQIKRLLVFMPPRHGKSFLVSQTFPAWYLGRRPTDQVIFTSYSQTIAEDFGRKIRNSMRSQVFSAVFPGVHLADDSSSAGRFHTNQGGALFAVGAGGALTGRGANLLIIDDIHKNREEANSASMQKAIQSWFGSTLYTRLMSNGVLVLVQTRWCENDLPGYILREFADEGWDVLELPAIADSLSVDPTYARHNPMDTRKVGEALWPSFTPLEELLDRKRVVGSLDFEALYQQRPSSQDGDLIKTSWLENYYDTLPARMDEEIISLDCTFKETASSDFVCMGAWGRKSADKYLMDVWRKRAGFVETCNALESFCAKFPNARVKLIEDKANGSAVIETMKRKIPGIIAVNPKESKTSRLNACAPEFEAGNIWLPRPNSSRAWVHDYKLEMTQFPNGANDDQVDMTTQALNHFRSKSAGDFSKDFIPKSRSTIAGSGGGGKKW